MITAIHPRAQVETGIGANDDAACVTAPKRGAGAIDQSTHGAVDVRARQQVTHTAAASGVAADAVDTEAGRAISLGRAWRAEIEGEALYTWLCRREGRRPGLAAGQREHDQ